jgi:hypothetical protein
LVRICRGEWHKLVPFARGGWWIVEVVHHLDDVRVIGPVEVEMALCLQLCLGRQRSREMA